jgi:anti-sigma regulatory factor (Ser/Thr protein kinase)
MSCPSRAPRYRSACRGHTVDVAETDTTNFYLHLTFDADAAGVARAFVQEHSDSLPQDLIDDAKLLVTELVSNAVRHGRPDITLRVSLHPPLIGVSVEDEGVTVPSTDIHPPDLEAPGGRGLMIVDRMSDSWGVIPTDPPPGKTVWFRLDDPNA